jgi:hypothetical protein
VRLDEWGRPKRHFSSWRCLSAKERASEIYGMHSVEILGEHIDKPLHDRDARAVS